MRSAPFQPPAPTTADTLAAVLLTLDRVQLETLLAGDPVRAAPWVRAAAEIGVIEGQVRFGRMLLEGRGVVADPARALAWFTRAAEAGDPEAQNMAGRCHENGWGTPADPAVAAAWYERATRSGHAWAQYNLGHLYLDGLGAPRDATLAYFWYRRAADQGHARAMNLVGRCHEEGWGVEPDADVAGAWYRRSAEGGYFRGQYNHADTLALQGRADEALRWFEAACDAAPPDNRHVMAQALARRREPGLRALGQRVLNAGATVD